MSLYMVHVIDVPCLSRCFQLHSRRQFHSQVVNLHLPHVAMHNGIYRQWIIRPLALKSCWHISHKRHQILLAQCAMQFHMQCARILVVEGIEIHC